MNSIHRNKLCTLQYRHFMSKGWYTAQRAWEVVHWRVVASLRLYLCSLCFVSAEISGQ